MGFSVHCRDGAVTTLSLKISSLMKFKSLLNGKELSGQQMKKFVEQRLASVSEQQHNRFSKVRFWGTMHNNKPPTFDNLYQVVKSSKEKDKTTLIFAKTRFCSHINFIGRCLQSKVIPKGFRSNFHASSFSRSNQYLYQIQCTQNSFSRNIMRITIRAMCLKRDNLDKQILQSHSKLSKICPVVLVNSIRTKIQELNATLFNHLNQIKTLKLEHLIGPKISSHATFDSQNTVVTIPENLPLTDSEKYVLSKGLNFVPITKRTNEFSVKHDVEKIPLPHSVESFFP